MDIGRALLFLLLAGNVGAFNIDVPSRLIYSGPKQSKFGYSVQFYQDPRQRETWVLVGAPEAATKQPRVVKGGMVYKCSTRGQACFELVFDSKGPRESLNGSVMIQDDHKSNQWFGATIVTSKTDDLVMACAPRYVHFFKEAAQLYWNPTGTCIVASNGLSSFRDYSPCVRTLNSGWHRLGSCMAGFSAAIGKDEQAFMGGPGAYYFQGSLISLNIGNGDTYSTDYTDYAADPMDKQDTGSPRITTAADKSYDDQYVGYAMAAGDFDGQRGSDVAVGVPRGSSLRGLVALYNAKNENLRNLTGEQVGSYFGAAVAVADLNNDQLDDLIIGAPLYSSLLYNAESLHKQEETKSKTDKGDGYEIGKVYVFFQSPDHDFPPEKSVGILGKKEWGRFGFSVLAAGDLNSDGFEDFIVGAPYDGDLGRGAIHVFNGNEEGKFDKPSQTIYGQQFPDIKAFGFSLAGGADVDDNTYPDVLVGSYLSDRAVMLKTRPVVSVTVRLEVYPRSISLDTETSPSVRLEICLKYTGKGVPDAMSFFLTMALDTDQTKEIPRAQFLISGRPKYNVPDFTIDSESEKCLQPSIDIGFNNTEKILDRLNPITVNVSVAINEGQSASRRTNLPPVRDALLPSFWTTQILIENNCGEDNKCIPDLEISVDKRDKVLAMGQRDRLTLHVAVVNKGMDAHQAMLFIKAPTVAKLTRIYNTRNNVTLQCSFNDSQVVVAPSRNDRQRQPPLPPSLRKHDPNVFSHRACSIGNPLRSGSKLELNLEYETEPTYSNELEFLLEVNSTLPDDLSTRFDNIANITVETKLKYHIQLHSRSDPPERAYSKDDVQKIDSVRGMTPSAFGPNVLHTYSLHNSAESPTIALIRLDIFFPYVTQGNQPLLYVLHDIITEGNVVCAPRDHRYINPYGLSVPYIQRNNTSGGARLYAQLRSVQNHSRYTSFDDDKERLEPDMHAVLHEQVKGHMGQAFLALVKQAKETGSKLLRSWRHANALNLDCQKLHCAQWTCDVVNLRPSETVVVHINSTLFLSTIEMDSATTVRISSMAVAEVKSLPEALDMSQFEAAGTFVSSAIATIVVNKKVHERPYEMPIWLLIVAILIGATLLSLLILLLCRVGFFKRNRPHRTQAAYKSYDAAENKAQYSTYSPSTQAYNSAQNPPSYGARI